MNALDEFKKHVEGKEILCARINWEENWHEQPEVPLPRNATQEQLLTFHSALNQEYDDGYGTQHLFGTIWFKDGSFSKRCEYDGSEWWEHFKTPEIPENL